MVPSRSFAAVCFTNGEGNPNAYCAKAADVFLGLDAPTPNVQAPSAATLALYAGTYVDPTGNLGTVEVTTDGSALSVAMSFSDGSANGPAQAFGESDFVVPFPTYELGASFFPKGGTPAQFLVTRAGVAMRQ
jgi:hypothetical protein